jgi:hypothetical protein
MKNYFLNHYLAICISARVAVATPTTAREIEKQQQQQNK